MEGGGFCWSITTNIKGIGIGNHPKQRNKGEGGLKYPKIVQHNLWTAPKSNIVSHFLIMDTRRGPSVGF